MCAGHRRPSRSGVELAADPKQPALHQTRQGQQGAGTGNQEPSRKSGAASSGRPRWASCRSKVRSLASQSKLIGTGSPSSPGAGVGSGVPVWSCAGGVALPVNCADGTAVAGGFPAAAVIPANAICALSAGFEDPPSLRMAFSLTPSRCADRPVAQPLSPGSSRCCADVSQRYIADPGANLPPRASAAIPPCA